MAPAKLEKVDQIFVDYKPQSDLGQASMTALLKDGATYHTEWADIGVCLGWIDRPVFRALPIRLSIPGFVGHAWVSIGDRTHQKLTKILVDTTVRYINRCRQFEEAVRRLIESQPLSSPLDKPKTDDGLARSLLFQAAATLTYRLRYRKVDPMFWAGIRHEVRATIRTILRIRPDLRGYLAEQIRLNIRLGTR